MFTSLWACSWHVKPDLDSRIKRIQIKSWQFISNINKATLLTSSNYEKNLIRLVWGKDATVIYPPCPQYSFSLSDQREDIVCSLARFTPEKGYDMILEVARRLPNATVRAYRERVSRHG